MSAMPLNLICKQCHRKFTGTYADKCSCGAVDWERDYSPPPEEEGVPTLLRTLTTMALMMFLAGGGGMAVWNYINKEHLNHDMLTTLRYDGPWAIGEYQDCFSLNKKEGTSPDMTCGSSSKIDTVKTFMVRFSGDLPFDGDKKDGAYLEWKCRRNDDAEIAFTCYAVQTPTSETQTQPAQNQSEPAPERALPPAEIASLRKRNQCENRFTDKGIYEVNGVTVGVACKQNPDLKP